MTSRSSSFRNERRARGFGAKKRSVPWLRIAAFATTGLVMVLAYVMFIGGTDDGPNVLVTAAPDLQVGSCFNADENLWLDTVSPANCYGPHAAEVVGVIDVSALSEDYPDLIEMRRYARAECHTMADLKFGLTLESPYRAEVSLPSAEAWANNERVAICNLVGSHGELLELPIAEGGR
ncbi:MAG: hypothetical protein HKN26_13810 [Acidimicrobiales bacterium]|nr:hypothetical protein [Acidimicrobiales bacterium]